MLPFCPSTANIILVRFFFLLLLARFPLWILARGISQSLPCSIGGAANTYIHTMNWHSGLAVGGPPSLLASSVELLKSPSSRHVAPSQSLTRPSLFVYLADGVSVLLL